MMLMLMFGQMFLRWNISRQTGSDRCSHKQALKSLLLKKGSALTCFAEDKVHQRSCEQRRLREASHKQFLPAGTCQSQLCVPLRI